MDKNKIKEIKFLRSVFIGQNIESNLSVDWRFITDFLKIHGLLPLFFFKIKSEEYNIPTEVYGNFKNKFYYNLSNNLILWKEFLRVIVCLKNEEVDVLPIKGMDICSRFNPILHLRSMFDIDLLVRKNDFERVQKILFSLGYDEILGGLKKNYWLEKQCHIIFRKNISSSRFLYLEIHWDLDFKRKGKRVLPDIWSRTIVKEVEGIEVELLSREDALFSFALHNRRYGNILSFKHSWDILQLLIKSDRGKKFDWVYIFKKSKKAEIQTVTYYTLLKVYFFTNKKIPSFNILCQFDVPEWKKQLIEKFLNVNLFSVSIHNKLRNLYLKTHFLVYDNLIDALLYIINIPYEQLCKFYEMKPYTSKANFLYKMWPLSFPIFYLLNLINKK